MICKDLVLILLLQFSYIYFSTTDIRKSLEYCINLLGVVDYDHCSVFLSFLVMLIFPTFAGTGYL